MNKKCVYCGSFDPFTKGHLYIIEQAVLLFDEVHVLICTNNNKTRLYDIQKMKDAIVESIEEEACNPNKSKIIVTICHDLTINYCIKNGIKYIVKGLRDVNDYMYEERISEFNSTYMISTIYFRARNIISSTIVRELISYNNSVIGMVPGAINRLIVKEKNKERIIINGKVIVPITLDDNKE